MSESDFEQLDKSPSVKLTGDAMPCAVCREPDSSDDNMILFCECCNLAVHQHCYGVDIIPDLDWLCYACQEAVVPLNQDCELCPFTGGAYKRCLDEGKWVHCLCAHWLSPEVYEIPDEEKNSGPMVDLSKMEEPDNKFRLKLRCAVPGCEKRHTPCSGMLQCAYGKCCVAAHPQCVVNGPDDDQNEFTWRTIEYQDWQHRQIFCPKHADKVGLPLSTKKTKKNLEIGRVVVISRNSAYELDDDFNIFPMGTIPKGT
eukprot:CAMPEP_0173244172 /NCGR_PEP_ID=MMETSP1142-20121109/15943_1 /TAXON_ID=483371 /ORGANISM="non described non described, Strain CCMP2298" /LENGTH=255 /DNA_ID=CAMNT_0014175913 /DNA_START=106 /DNA_END=869 /DNA_ORIENTATION=-